MIATAAGFFAGGWFAARRDGSAPILHAVAIGLFSLLLWVLVNLLPAGAHRTASWDAGAGYVGGLVLLQIAAAAIGGRFGAPAGGSVESS